MVSVSHANIYALREFLLKQAIDKAGEDPFKVAFLVTLNLLPTTAFTYNDQSASLYQKCALSGLDIEIVQTTAEEFLRLLGQSSIIDGTPRPWVGDIWGVLGIKFAIDALGNDEVTNKFASSVKFVGYPWRRKLP